MLRFGIIFMALGVGLMNLDHWLVTLAFLFGGLTESLLVEFEKRGLI